MVRHRDEQVQLADVIQRLAKDYPTVSPTTVIDVVTDLHAHFNGARLREFIPMLVERSARTALTELSVCYENTPPPKVGQ